MKRSFLFAFAVLAAFSCLRPSEERAERDLEVGQAARAGLSVQVEDGLAAVRTLSAGELVLWGSAPGFGVQLSSDEPLELTIEIQNCLPEAELTLSGSPGASLEALGTGEALTRKRWRLQAPAGDVQLRLAAPDETSTEHFEFALMSDVQEAIDRVQDVFSLISAQPNVRFLLGAGDLTTTGEAEQLEEYQDELLQLRVPYFTTLGNHELGVSPENYHDYFGRGNFQFRFHGVYFTLLDSASGMLDPMVFDWLDGWLARGRQGVHVVAMHIPPLDPAGIRNGAWASRNDAAKFLVRLAEARVDLTLYGHVHSYYSFENAGIPAFISGGGGANPERFDKIGRHFMVFDIDAQQGVLSHRVVRVD